MSRIAGGWRRRPVPQDSCAGANADLSGSLSPTVELPICLRRFPGDFLQFLRCGMNCAPQRNFESFLSLTFVILIIAPAHLRNLPTVVMLKKTPEERIGELRRSLQFIQEQIQHFKKSNNSDYLFFGIGPQLRALVCFNPDKPRKSTLSPLLLDLAAEHDIELPLYSAAPKAAEDELGVAISVLASKTWSVLPTLTYQKYQLRDWIVASAYHINPARKYFSRNQIIRNITEKGAVHFDPDVGELVDSLRRITSSGYSGLEFFIIDTAAAVYYSGLRFLRFGELKFKGIADPDSHEIIRELEREFDALSINLMKRGSGLF